MSGIWRKGNAITEAAHRMNDIGWDFSAQAPNKNFDGIRIAIEILLIEMIDKLRARDHSRLMVHQVG